MSRRSTPELRSEFLRAAVAVLRRYRRPLRPKEIVDLGLREGFFSDKRIGVTPDQTMKSKLSVHIRRYGDASPFVRTGPGRFYLRELLGASPPRPVDDEDQRILSKRDLNQTLVVPSVPYHAEPLTPP